jgi:hypothetical protein
VSVRSAAEASEAAAGAVDQAAMERL